MHVYSGPEGTCFEGGVFPAKLIFPPDYPLSPPKMQFTCEMFHPNSKDFFLLKYQITMLIHHESTKINKNLPFFSLCRW